MPSPFEFAANPTPSTASLNVTDLIRMYTGLIKALPRQEEDIIIQKFVLQSEIDIHDTETIAGQPLDVTDEEFDDHVNSLCYRKQIPSPVHSDPLVYTNTNASGFTFPTPDTTPGNSEGAAGITDGSSYLLIEDNTNLNPTDKFSIAMNLYIPSSPTPSGNVIDKLATFGWALKILNATTLQLVVNTSTPGTATINIPFSTDTWFKLVVSYESTFGIRAKVDNGTLLSSTSVTGNIVPTSTRLGIFAKQDGTLKMQAGSGISWLVYLHGEVIAVNSGLWVTNYQNGLIITNPSINSNYIEITTIPFLGNLEAQTNMTSGLFFSG